MDRIQVAPEHRHPQGCCCRLLRTNQSPASNITCTNASELEHPHGGTGSLADEAGDLGAGSVVAANPVADADHHRAPCRRQAHSRSTSRRRKWVAQEMQGS